MKSISAKKYKTLSNALAKIYLWNALEEIYLERTRKGSWRGWKSQARGNRINAWKAYDCFTWNLWSIVSLANVEKIKLENEIKN